MAFLDPALAAATAPAPYVLGSRDPYIDPATGSRYYHPTRTTILPHIYIDPLDGSDTNDGLSAGRPLRSFDGLLAHPLVGPPGNPETARIVRDFTIGIIGHAGHIYLESYNFGRSSPANGYRMFHRVSWVRVGAEPVKFMGSRPASRDAFLASPTITRAFQIEWTHNLARNGEFGTSRARVWIDNKPLRRVASQAVLEPGTFCYDGYPVWGRPLVITIMDHDGADLRSDDRAVEITAAKPQDPPALDLQAVGSEMRVRNSVFSGFNTPIGLLAYSSGRADPVIDSDVNAVVQSRAFIRYRNVSYTLQQWRAISSRDASSIVLASFAGLGLGAGKALAIDSVDIRPNLAGAAYSVLADPLTQAEAPRLLSRPKTLAQAEAYLLSARSLVPVYAAAM